MGPGLLGLLLVVDFLAQAGVGELFVGVGLLCARVLLRTLLNESD